MLSQRDLLSLFEPLLERIREGMIICDEDGAIMTMNPAVCSLFQVDSSHTSHSLADLGGHNLRASLIKAGVDKLSRSRQRDEIIEFDEQIEVAGETRCLHISARVLDLPDQTEALHMLVVSDITAEQRLLAVMDAKQACGVVTQDAEMMRLIHRLSTVAASDASVLLQGESGTGKTELARLLYRQSARSDKPLIEINCGAIPATLIETELFGHVKGAFTGAVKDREGRFKAADGGTLFLDEIGELPRELQPKLLRVLQDGEYEPVGSDTTVKVDVRLVCASNQDLARQVDNGQFRPDLYYRVAVIPLQVPPLRERPADIPLLIDVIQKRLAMRGNYSAEIRFEREALSAVMNYPWPGNVRELANAVEHSTICSQQGIVTMDSLPDTIRYYCDTRQAAGLNEAESAAGDQRAEIEQALRNAKGNKTLAAQMLGVDRTTLWRRMQRLGIT